MKPARHVLDLFRIARDYRAQQCQALATQARADSSAVLKQAQLKARRHLRSTLAPELERFATEIALSRSRLMTLRRVREQRRLAAVLRQAWPRLTHALRERWDSSSGRACWVLHHLSIALVALPAKGWVIQHPQNWPAGEREQLNQWLQTQGITGAAFEDDAELLAGIRVVCGLNVLDASLDGLLSDRAQIEGRLLHYLAAAL